MVWVALKREVSRVPSPRRICRDMVGSESFTSTVGGAVEVDAAGVVLAGAEGVAASRVLPGPGVGLPNL